MKKNLFKAALFTPMRRGRWGLPMCAWSKPGEAKTSIIEELGEDFDMPVVVLSPGEMGEGGFGVVPVPDRSGVIKYPPPEWTLLVKDGGLVFIDELTGAGPALQPALLGLFLEKRIGGSILHPRTRCLAAANPVEYAANGTELNPAQANRMGHIEWTAPTADEHANFMTRGTTGHSGETSAKFSAIEEEARVLAAWNNGAWARAVGLETAYIKAQPHVKNDCPLASDPRSSRGWASDRSWEFAARALASADVQALSEADTDEFVASFIGEASYAEFKKFVTAQDLPDAAKLLDGDVDSKGNKVTFQHDQSRPDRTYAVLNACLALVLPVNAPRREDRAAGIWNILADLFSAPVSQDLVVVPAEQLVGAKLSGNHTNPKLQAAYRPLGQSKAFTEMLRLSGFKSS